MTVTMNNRVDIAILDVGYIAYQMSDMISDIGYTLDITQLQF